MFTLLWSYRETHFLEKSKYPKVLYATQQRARFSEDYMEPHGADIENMDHYLEAKDLTELFYILRKTRAWKFFQMPISVVTGTRRQLLKVSVT